jgi:hypothetical protein
MTVSKDGSTINVEIFWGDLTPDAQRLLQEVLGDNGNHDLIPLVELEFEEEEIHGTEPEL